MASTERDINVDQYVKIQDYTPHGREVTLGDHTQLYVSGSNHSKHGVIMIPDMMEWNTGRVRNICDFFGDHDFFAVIPDFTTRGIEGETKSYMESKSVMDWYKSLTFDGNLKPTILSTMKYMRKEGVDKICLLGFAWGSWVVVNLLACPDCAKEFRCGALCSPSIELEETVYGGTVAELISRLERPVLLMPTAGDPEYHKAYMKLLTYRVPSSLLIPYYDLEDHFMLRGDPENIRVRQAFHKSLNEIHCFFQNHYAMTTEDLVRTIEGYMTEGMQQARELVQQLTDRMREGTRSAGESLGEHTMQLGEAIGDRLKAAGEYIKNKFSADTKTKEEESRQQQHQNSG